MSKEPIQTNPLLSEDDLIHQRREKLHALRQSGIAYPNNFKPDAFIGDLINQYHSMDSESLVAEKKNVSIAGRIMLRRIMGRASFIHIQDVSGRLQVYLREEDISKEAYEQFKTWDLGDFVGVEGFIFKTKTGELSVHAKKIRLMVKSIRPLPDKFHGLVDVEKRYRQRYLDLMVNEETRKVFLIRSKVIEYIRHFLRERCFLEVETPMMQMLAGGANAKPFVTHHEALNIPLYLRIAPELYLKRLVVGGFERVFEINRNFRNEGISIRHNPEFTMLEFYQAYADYHDLMDLTEEMLRGLVQSVLETTQTQYGDYLFDWSQPFERVTMKESILKYNSHISMQDLNNLERIRVIARELGVEIRETDGLGKAQTAIFETTVEHRLIPPTFVTAYPAEVSPLARRNDRDPFVTDRFELFVAGRELGNGFSELNDPEDQAERFKLQSQAKSAGDEEAMHYDADYITALEYGMPPTAGEGIGIDRLVMLLTNRNCIRDVILFPHMKPVEKEL